MRHIDSLNLMLSNERIRLANAKTEKEHELRQVWVRQIEKEIESEGVFITQHEMTDDELMRELGA